MRSAIFVLCLGLMLSGVAAAGGLGLPSSHFGLGLGNLTEFTGLRLNVRDDGVRRVSGVNFTLWTPAGDNGGLYQGLGLHLVGASGDRFQGIQVCGVGMAVAEEAQGIFVSGVGFGGADMTGIMVAGVGMGASDLRGITVAGVGAGASRVQGVLLAGLGAGTERIDGLAAALLGFGTEDANGVVVAGLGIGGHHLRGLFAGGLGVGAETLHGVGLGGGIKAAEVHGLALGVAYQRRGICDEPNPLNSDGLRARREREYPKF